MARHTAAHGLGTIAVLVAIGTIATAQQPTFRTAVRLIEANAVVHDRAGNPVTDLTAADFKVFEDGKEQKVEFFAIADGRPATASSAATPILPPGVVSNRTAAVAAGRVTVVLFDRLNSTFEDQKAARDQIVKYLGTLQPTDRVALYVLESETITIVHEFSSDRARLTAALSKYVGTSSTELTRSEEQKPLVGKIGIPEVDAETEAWLTTTMQTVQEFYLRRRARLTTDALEAIANHLAAVPGRKNLVWVSAAFPFVFPDPYFGPQVMNEPVNRATRAVNAANVAIYPVDIRGLVGAFNPATVTATVDANPKAMATGQQFTSFATVAPNQDTMRTIADDTGGRVFLNSNAIGESVARAVADARVSYVLGYYSSRRDDKFHRLEVKVNRDGLDVRYRKGFVAVAPPPRTNAKARLTALEQVMISPLEASAIELLASFERHGAAGTLTVRLNPDSLTWQERNAVREGSIDIIIAQSTPDGRYFKAKEMTAGLSADAARYRQMQEEGFTLSSEITIVPSAYQLHVVVADVGSGAVGSLIIPLRGGG